MELEQGFRFHHLGLAVARPDKVLRFLKSLNYCCQPQVFDPNQNVNLIFCTSAEMPNVEVIFPADGVSPIDGYLAKSESLIYHLCYETWRLSEALETLRRENVRIRLVSGPKPAVLFGNKMVSFYYIDGFGLVEYIENEGV